MSQRSHWWEGGLWQRIREKWISILSVLVFVLVWYMVTEGTDFIEPNFLPSPNGVLLWFIKWLVRPAAGETLPGHIWASFQLVIGSFCIAVVIGIPLGILMGWYTRIERLVNPFFQMIRPIPPLAWIPLAIVWFGIGMVSKIYVITLSAFVPSLINAYTGVKTVDPVLVHAARTLGAGQKDILRKVVFPHCLPYIFVGVRLSLNACWMTLVAAELVAAVAGLGYSIQIARRTMDPPMILVAMLVIGFIGMAMIRFMKFLEARLCPWYDA